MKLIHRLIAVSTCPQMHMHGQFEASLGYFGDPTFTLRVRDDFEAHQWEFSRTLANGASFAEWLQKAKPGALVDLNARTSVKIRESLPDAVSFRIVDHTPDGEALTMLVMHRAKLISFLLSTESVVPLEVETTTLQQNLDQVLAGILGQDK